MAQEKEPTEATQAIFPGLKLRHTLSEHEDTIFQVSWSPDGQKLASSSKDGTIRIWEVETGRTITTLTEQIGKFNRVAWSPDGRILALSSEDKTVQLWDIEIEKVFITFKGHQESVFNLSWSPKGRWLASGDENTIRLWDTTSGRLQKTFQTKPHHGKFTWSPDGSTLAWAVNLTDTIHLWDCETGKQSGELRNADFVNELSWSPDGRMLASGDNNQGLHLWEIRTRKLLWARGEHLNLVHSIAWSPDGQVLASSSGLDTTIRIWNAQTGQTVNILEGHTEGVSLVSFSFDGKLLASGSEAGGGTIRLWRTTDWLTVATISGLSTKPYKNTLAFHPVLPILATLDKEIAIIRIWDLDYETLLNIEPSRTVKYTSAKIVLVGESNVGKSCLAMRLAEDRYPADHEQGTTHGMRFWPMKPEQLSSNAIIPEGQRRDIVLWDLGGQDEYRLVHQLFLHDTTLALILLDPTRGRTAFEEVEAWNKRLEKQLQGRPAVKLLIGSKMDKPSGLIDKFAIKKLCHDCGFSRYYETSAKRGRGIKKLREAIANALDWDSLAKTSRPELFQRIRDEIDQRRAEGEVFILLSELAEAIRQAYPEMFEAAAVSAVAEQLAVQGVIADTKLTSGEHALVLQLPVIERYAGSLIVAARNNLRGVPALEERALASLELRLPGIEKRLSRYQEMTILECVVELFIQHGICFRHQGLLIFPTLFPEIEADSGESLPHSVSLYYDFTGAIDNIYASLVAWLVISSEFGPQRLWANRVEFDEPSQGICGIRQIKRKSGLAHIDLFFAEETKQERRNFFIRFVEDHLRRHGVEVREHQAIKCRGCSYEISEEIVQENIARDQTDVICPKCRTFTFISEGVEMIREHDQESDHRIFALRTEIEKRTKENVQKAKQAIAGDTQKTTSKKEDPIRILHLSDLHFTGETSPQAKIQWLVNDINKGEGLGFESLEYLVISGDFTDKGREEGFEKAREFVSLLIAHFGLSAQRCIFVPGNHDVQDQREAYDWRENVSGLKPGQWVKQGDIFLVRNDEKYPLRLKKFSDAFFHKIIQQPYPFEYRQQGIAYLFPDTQIQFLTLNSCWQIDQFNRKRSDIQPEALAQVIQEADKQTKDAVERRDLNKGSKVLRLGVWHHAVAGPEMMQNTDFIGHLQNNGVKLCLHGDVHEMRRDLIGYWHEKRANIVGAGSFGSPAEGRPESTPRLYNLLEIRRDLTSVRIHTRCQPKPDGPWKGWNEWPRPDGGDGAVPYYDINLT